MSNLYFRVDEDLAKRVRALPHGQRTQLLRTLFHDVLAVPDTTDVVPAVIYGAYRMEVICGDGTVRWIYGSGFKGAARAHEEAEKATRDAEPATIA